jgi:SET domain-containing protein
MIHSINGQQPMSAKTNNPLFRVRRSGIHGRGVFAARRIRKGTRLIEYVGERIPSKVGDSRYPINGQVPYHTFLFSINNKICIDAGVDGNDARFINHSCDPNCEAVDEEGRIFIEAIRTIQPGEELSYDYHLTGPTPRSKAEKAPFVCLCGAPNCRGTMLKLPERKSTSQRQARQ